jgi:DNA (cytosine-5)-methyltransferase 1
VNHYLSKINSLEKPTAKVSGMASVSVFSGGGGLDLGLSLAGFDISYASDEEKYYCDTLNLNFPGRFVDVKDIKDINDKSICEVIGEAHIELLSGGSPCQSFSILGKRKSFDDERGQLVFEFIRLIEELAPNVFIFENVPGILTLNKGNDWELLLSRFESTGYKIYQKVLNAADFGIPQIRKRLFVIGFRKAINFDFPSPTHYNPSQDPNLLEYCLSKWLPAKLAFENISSLPNHDIRPHGTQIEFMLTSLLEQSLLDLKQVAEDHIYTLICPDILQLERPQGFNLFLIGIFSKEHKQRSIGKLVMLSHLY